MQLQNIWRISWNHHRNKHIILNLTSFDCPFPFETKFQSIYGQAWMPSSVPGTGCNQLHIYIGIFPERTKPYCMPLYISRYYILYMHLLASWEKIFSPAFPFESTLDESWLPRWLKLCNLSVIPWILSTKLCLGSDETVGGTSIILFIFGIDPDGAHIFVCLCFS